MTILVPALWLVLAAVCTGCLAWLTLALARLCDAKSDYYHAGAYATWEQAPVDDDDEATLLNESRHEKRNNP